MDKPMFDFFSILTDPYHVVNMMELDDDELELAAHSNKNKNHRRLSKCHSKPKQKPLKVK